MVSTISDEAQRVLDEAKKRGITLRLFGGVAVKYHCPSASHRALQRSYPDLDFVGHKKQGRDIRKLLADLGYQPEQRFNALHGDTRLIYEDEVNQRVVDIFLDIFKMCHTLELGKRLELDDYTIPISDLLLTKLQVVEINEKDVRDLVAIIEDHPVETKMANSEREKIDADYIASLCSEDWPLCTTVTLTLKKIPGFFSKYELTEQEKATVKDRIDSLLAAIEAAPKSLKWRLRAKVGEKKRWYDLPEVPIRTQRV
jgi:Uncharacterised nucleotidyltransferase